MAPIFWQHLYSLSFYTHELTNTTTSTCTVVKVFRVRTLVAGAPVLAMGRGPSLSANNRSQALGMLRAGQSTRQVAAVFGVAQSTISRLLQRFNATNSVADRRRSGRPRVTTGRQDRYLRNMTLRNRRMTARRLQGELRTATGVNVSDQTIRNRLRADNLRSRRPAVRTPLTERHRRAHREWCRRHVQWTQQQWSRVVFSDKS